MAIHVLDTTLNCNHIDDYIIQMIQMDVFNIHMTRKDILKGIEKCYRTIEEHRNLITLEYSKIDDYLILLSAIDFEAPLVEVSPVPIATSRLRRTNFSDVSEYVRNSVPSTNILARQRSQTLTNKRNVRRFHQPQVEHQE